MKLILFPLSVLIIIMLVVTAYDMSAGSSFSFNDFNNPFSVDDGSYSGEQNVNGSSQSFGVDTTFGEFSPDMLNGIIAVVIALSAVGAVAGIRVVGSGLSETSVKIIYNTVFFYAIWGILSVYALNIFTDTGLNSMPYGSGYVIWVILTLLYSLGIVQQINGGSTGGSA